MRRFLAIVTLAACAAAQQNQNLFECSAVGPIPAPPAVDCGFLSGVNASIATSTGCAGMPTQGAQCAKVEAVAGGAYLTALDPGGYVPRPLPAGISEMRSLVPTGTTEIRYDWQFFGNDNATYNDGFEIAICDAAGNRILVLSSGNVAIHGPFNCVIVYGTHSILGFSTPPGAYLSVVAYNFLDACCGGTYAAIDNLYYSKNNDEQFAADSVGACVNGPYNNAWATNSPGVLCNGEKDVWFEYVPQTTGTHTFSTVGLANFDTVINVFSGLFGANIGCNDDVAGAGGQSELSLTLNAGQAYYVSVGGWFSAVGDFSLRVSAPRQVSFASPNNGELSLCVTGATPNSFYFAPMTLAPGAFPNGTFYGLDVSLFDLLIQLGSGAPFFGAIGPDGNSAISGPYGPGLSGLTIYTVLLDNVGAPGFTATAPQSYTVP